MFLSLRFRFAKLYSLNKLKDGALSLMMSKFKEVVHGPEFKQLTAEDLIEYISCNLSFYNTICSWFNIIG